MTWVEKTGRRAKNQKCERKCAGVVTKEMKEMLVSSYSKVCRRGAKKENRSMWKARGK
jgi:hypothetical protein